MILTSVIRTACLALLLGCLTPHVHAQAQKSEEELVQHSTGACAGQALYATYMAINTLGDAWMAKAYKDDVALQLAGSYEGGIGAMSKSLKELLTNHKSLSENDRKLFSDIVESCELISAQITAFSELVKTRDQAKAKIFEANRQAAKAKIFGLLGIDDGEGGGGAASSSGGGGAPTKLEFEITKASMPGGKPGQLGNVTFTRGGEGKTFSVLWKYKNGGSDKGFAVPFPNSGVIAVGFGPDVLGVAIYKRDGKKVEAQWANYQADADIGAYNMVQGKDETVFNIEGEGGGSIGFEMGRERTANVTWTLPVGVYKGIAVADGDYLAAVSIKPGGQGGVAIYTANVEDGTAAGRWAMTGATGAGEESYKLISAGGAGASAEDPSDTVKALAETIRVKGASVLLKLKPTDEQIKAIAATAADAAKLKAYTDLVYDKIGGAGQLAKEGQTEVNVISGDQLPGGYQQHASHLKSGVTVYGFEFVKPGEKFGMSYDGLVQVDGQWVMIPKMWRAFAE